MGDQYLHRKGNFKLRHYLKSSALDELSNPVPTSYMLSGKHVEEQLKAIHLICRRKGIGFEGLDPAPDGQKNVYISYAWVFPKDINTESLVGRWVYLHPVSKNAPSEFGGIIRDVIDDVDRPGKARSEGQMIVFEAKKEAKGKKWRGNSHGMAWTGGIVEAKYQHESRGINA